MNGPVVLWIDDLHWVDDDTAISMHRVRTNNKSERRLQRLASPTPGDHRISYGCINVPAAFYESVVAPTIGSSGSVVYVLPESHPARGMFEALALDLL